MGNIIIENSQNSGVRLFNIESSVHIIIHTNKRVYNERTCTIMFIQVLNHVHSCACVFMLEGLLHCLFLIG